MACSFCPTPCPLPNGVDAVGEGEKKAGYARLQNPTNVTQVIFSLIRLFAFPLIRWLLTR